jgi:HEPN domain-containing protein
VKADDTLPEHLCYHAQQAAEKAIKAVLVSRDVDFPWVHALEHLLNLCWEAGVPIPQSARRAIDLSDYASITRYPGDYEPVTEAEVSHAIAVAQDIIDWAQKLTS